LTPSSPTRRRRILLRTAAGGAGLAVAALVALLYVFRPAEPVVSQDTTVHDWTRLVSIPVERVLRPAGTAEVQAILHDTKGIVSIGGGRFSMGGQIATEGTTFLDTRARLNDILAIDAENRVLRVEAGATWRQVQEAIDPYDLSVRIMQSYNNFTVGGTLSVNAHGRYVNQGAVIHSVRGITLVLADGTVRHCSRAENPQLFDAAIGGYGGIGVITEVELDLAENVRVERRAEWMPVTAFRRWFDANLPGSPTAVFFNADLYPPDYDELVAITFSRTGRELTVPDRLQSKHQSTTADRFVYWMVSEMPLGKTLRSDVIDRLRLGGQPVVWRNFEASYDVNVLEPTRRDGRTYLLQEYFIPVDRFDDFVPAMARVLRDHDVNVMNVSIRHATADSESLLTWSPSECFAFVIYYKQGLDEAARAEVGAWTRALIDEALAVGGTFYLPYQVLATPAQFHAAYPRAREFFALKRQVDPDYRFRNKLWDRYYEP